MKKVIFSAVIIFAVGFSAKHTSDKANAVVNQVQGVYIFIDSKPVAEYEYLGTVDTKGVVSSNPQYKGTTLYTHNIWGNVLIEFKENLN